MRIILTLLVCLLVAAAPSAMAGDTTWQGGNGDSWHQDNNWSNNAPTANDRAIITNGTRPEIDNSAVAKAGRIVIENSGSHVKILANATLELGKESALTSQINNAGKLEVVGSLLIRNAVTIEGDNGDVVLSNGVISEKPNESGVLTIAHTCEDSVNDTCSVRLRGEGTVNVMLVNNAFVYADLSNQTLVLDTDPKSGSGVWEARDNGVLSVECSVGGAGQWRVTDFDGGMIQLVNGGCVGTSGAVTLTGENQSSSGVLFHVDDDLVFCSLGSLTFQSTDSVFPMIEVVLDGVATFGADACANCP